MRPLEDILPQGIYELLENELLPIDTNVRLFKWKVQYYIITQNIGLTRYGSDIVIYITQMDSEINVEFHGLRGNIFHTLRNKMRMLLINGLEDPDVDIVRLFNIITRTIDNTIEVVSNLDIVRTSTKRANN